MSWLTKAVGNAKKWVHKASGSVQSFSSKAGNFVHDVNKGIDSFGKSTIGKALLDAVPEGHLIFDAVRGTTGLAEKGLQGAEYVAKGIKGISNAKSLKQALNDGKKLYASTAKGLAEGREGASKLERQRKRLPTPSSVFSRFKMR